MADLFEDGEWGRLATETSLSYDAFCVYRDLGPGRSIARAIQKKIGFWKKSRQNIWETWSSQNRWVERALAYDAKRLDDKRKVREEEERKLEERRFRFEVRDQERLEERVQKIELVLAKADAAPVTDVKQEREVVEDGKVIKTRTEVEGINFSGYAALLKAQNETASLAINGPRKGRVGDPVGEKGGEVVPVRVVNAEFSLFKPDLEEEKAA